MEQTINRKLIICVKNEEDLCPLDYKQCPCVGDDVLQHLKLHFPYTRNTNAIKVNLKKTAEIRICNLVNDTRGKNFWVELWYSAHEINVNTNFLIVIKFMIIVLFFFSVNFIRAA